MLFIPLCNHFVFSAQTPLNEVFLPWRGLDVQEPCLISKSSCTVPEYARGCRLKCWNRRQRALIPFTPSRPSRRPTQRTPTGEKEMSNAMLSPPKITTNFVVFFSILQTSNINLWLLREICHCDTLGQVCHRDVISMWHFNDRRKVETHSSV